MIKQRKDSISYYEEAGRVKLAESENSEIAIIKEFLPKQLSDLEIEMIKVNLSIFDKSRNEPEKLSQIDSQFHSLIYGACNNKYLSQTLKLLRVRIGLLRLKPFDKPARIKSTYKGHMELFKALKSHDPDLAEKAMSKHISSARKYRLSLLK